MERTPPEAAEQSHSALDHETRGAGFLRRRRVRFWLRHAVAAGILMALTGFAMRGLWWRHSLWVDEVFSLATATGHSLEHPAAMAVPEEGDFVEPDEPRPAHEFRRYLFHGGPPASLRQVLRAVFLSDTSPPLYYVLLHGWTRVLGVTDADLRAFSSAWSLLCIPLMLLIGRRLGGWRVALLGTSLLCVSPAFLYYGTEARMYSQLWFFLLCVVWATLRLRARGSAWPENGAWVVAAAAGLLTHYFFIFPLAALVACLLAWPGRDLRLANVARVLVAVVTVYPWYRWVPESLANWRVTQEWLTWEPHGFTRIGAAARLFSQFFTGDGHHLWWDYPVFQVLLALVFGYAFVRWKRRGRATVGRPVAIMVIAWFVAGCVGPLAFDFARGTYTADVPRYAVTALPAACLLGAAALRVVNSRLRELLLPVVFAALVWTSVSIYRDDARNDQPFWILGRALSAEATASDLILVHSIPSGVLAVARYTDSEAPIGAWVEQLGTRSLPWSIERLVAGRRRVFLVVIHSVGAPVPEEAWLRANGRVWSESRHGNGRVVEFRPSDLGVF